MSYLRLSVIGKLGGNPVKRQTEKGLAVTTFSVAYNTVVGTETQTAWFRITTWGNLAEVCAQYLTQGSEVLVEGRLTFDPITHAPKLWQDQNGAQRTSFEITASHVEFIKLSQTAPADDQAPFDENEVPF